MVKCLQASPKEYQHRRQSEGRPSILSEHLDPKGELRHYEISNRKWLIYADFRRRVADVASLLAEYQVL